MDRRAPKASRSTSPTSRNSVPHRLSTMTAAADAVAENAAIGTTVGVTAFSDDADAHRHDHLLAGRQRRRPVRDRFDDRDRHGRRGQSTVKPTGPVDRSPCGPLRPTDRSRRGSSRSRLTMSMNSMSGRSPTVTSTANAVNENAANGTVVGVTALARDADATNNTITYTLDDNAGGRFAIDGSTGVVTVADGTLLDREAAASHNITVRATSSDGSFNTQVMTINVNDVDEFDVGPVTDIDGAANEVDENAIVGTVVGITAGPVMPTPPPTPSPTRCR